MDYTNLLIRLRNPKYVSTIGPEMINKVSTLHPDTKDDLTKAAEAIEDLLNRLAEVTDG